MDPGPEAPPAAPDGGWVVLEAARRIRILTIALAVFLGFFILFLCGTLALARSPLGVLAAILLIADAIGLVGVSLYYGRCPVCGWWTRLLYYCGVCGVRLRVE